MDKIIKLTWWILVLISTGATAQTGTPVTNNNDGIPGVVPVYSGSASLAAGSSSPISVSGNNVGIGTTSPKMPLDVGIYSTTSLFAGITLENIIGDGNYNSPMLLLGSGTWFNNGQFLRAAALQAVNDNWNVGQKALAFYTYDGHLGNNFTSATLTDLYERMRISSSGNVGIGTTNPGRKLEIAGDVQIDGSLYFGSNTQPQSASYAGVQCSGADYAEAVDVSGDRTKYEPGDILVLDPNAPGKFLKSHQAYSTLVAGIYSTKPGFVGRLEPSTPQTDKSEVPMAMVGRVPTKVTTENGPIRVGDLLVASSTLGRAMKGTDRSLLTGAVIGKAMGNLDSGTGVIEVLVTLQ